MNDAGLIVPRTLTPSAWRDTVPADQMMHESITWEWATSFPLTYMNDDGAGSAVVLVFSIPVDDENARLLAFPIDVSQIGVICMEMAGALAAVHGKTLDEVMRDARARIKLDEL